MVRRRIRGAAFMFLLVAGHLLTVAGPALAHVELALSTPSDGAVLAEPLERFELVFTEAAEPVPGRIQLVGEGRALLITVFQPFDDTVVVEPAEPLVDGQYALLWEVEAADAHREEGTISITVAVPGTTPQEDASTAEDEAAQGDEPAETTTPPPVVTTTSLPMVSERLPERALQTAPVAVDSTDNPSGQALARIGRWMLMIGALVAIGALVFAGTALVGSEEEVRRVVSWVRRGGMLVLAGTIIEVLGESISRAGSLVDLLAGSFGVAVLLRLAGGIALLQDPRLATTHTIGSAPDEAHSVEMVASREPGAVAVAVAPPRTESFRLDVRKEWVAIVGAMAVAASFGFDGHTASVEHSVVARSASWAHILAGSVWFGGLIAMATTLTRRWRTSTPLEAATMAIRFSRAATAAVIVATIAGVALTWTIIESPGDLLSGAWGRLLLVKVALVVAVASVGGYNHFKVVPELDRNASDVAASDRLRRLVRTEAAALSAVVAITAFLVNAAP